MRSINLADVGHKKIAEQAFQDILAIAHNEQAWKVPHSFLCSLALSLLLYLRTSLSVVCAHPNYVVIHGVCDAAWHG